jgi:hypothetical protein
MWGLKIGYPKGPKNPMVDHDFRIKMAMSAMSYVVYSIFRHTTMWRYRASPVHLRSLRASSGTMRRWASTGCCRVPSHGLKAWLK